MSGQTVSLGTIKTKIEIFTGTTTSVTVPTGAVFAEIYMVGCGGGGSSHADITDYGGGGGSGATSIYRFPVNPTTNYFVSDYGNGGTAGISGGATSGGTGGLLKFKITDSTYNANTTTFVATPGGGSPASAPAYGAGGASDSTNLALFQSIPGESSGAGTKATTIVTALGGNGGGLGGGLSGFGPGTTKFAVAGIPYSGGGGGGGSGTDLNGTAGGRGYIHVIWYLSTNNSLKISSVPSQSYVFTASLKPYIFPAPLGAQFADLILIGGGGAGGSVGTNSGGAGGGQGIISYSPFVIPQGTANNLYIVGTDTGQWYAEPATREKNAPSPNTTNAPYWINSTPGGDKSSSMGAYIAYYGIFNNTTNITSAFLSFGVDDSGSVILNGQTVISFQSGLSGFSSPSITLIPGKNTFIIYSTNLGGSSGVWLAVTSSTGGAGTVIYRTDNTWTWTFMYSCTVGSGANLPGVNGNLTSFSLNSTNANRDSVITIPNYVFVSQFTAGGGKGGVDNATTTSSGTAIITRNTSEIITPVTGGINPPNSTNTYISSSPLRMYISGSTGAVGSLETGKPGGKGGSFTGGAGGTATAGPTAGQTNGGGGGGGGSDGGTTGANGGDGLALVTFYGGSISLPISLYAVSTRTDIYTTGSSPTGGIPIPTGAYILKLILIGAGGKGGAFTTGLLSTYFGGGGGSGALGMWIIPVSNIGNINYEYKVGTYTDHTTFTINSVVFSAYRGATAVFENQGGAGGAAPTSPSAAVNMVQSLAGIAGANGTTTSGGSGGGLYGGTGSGTGNGKNGGVGCGGGGCPSGKDPGTEGNGMIVATWYYKNPNISLTQYTNGPYVSSTAYSNYTAGTYTVSPPAGTTSFSAYIIGGQGGGAAGSQRATSTKGGNGGGSGGTSGYLYISGISYTGGSISVTVGSGGTAGTFSVSAGSGGFSSLTYSGTEYKCGGTTFAGGGAGIGGTPGTGNSTFSGGGTSTNGLNGNSGAAGGPTGYAVGGGSTTLTVSYSDGKTKSFSSGAGGKGANVADQGRTIGTAGTAGGIYIIYS